jgi:hypothetical protein
MRNVKLTNDPYKNILNEVRCPNEIYHRIGDLMEEHTRIWFTMVSIHTPVCDVFRLPDCTHV